MSIHQNSTRAIDCLLRRLTDQRKIPVRNIAATSINMVFLPRKYFSTHAGRISLCSPCSPWPTASHILAMSVSEMVLAELIHES